jgi:MFS family permease
VAAITGEITASDSESLTRDQLAYGFRLLAITTFCMTLALSSFDSIQANFFRDSLGMDGEDNGYLIAIREVPGFLLIFISAIMLRKGLATATAISIFVAGVGFSLFAFTHTFSHAIIPILICSVGYHSWLQLQYALGLSLARNGEEGTTLGRLQGIGFLGTFLALVLVWGALQGTEWILGDDHQDRILRIFWVLAGAVAVVGAITIRNFPQSDRDRKAALKAPRLTWSKDYWLYYVLATLDGSRQQIYFAFAPFVLVERFDVPARHLILVLIISALIKWRMGEVIGGLVDRLGEKMTLNIAYTLHLITFLGFAFSPNVWFAYVFYLGYNFLFLFSIGTTTYIKKIARHEDLTQSLAMGVSLAHLTAIVVPVFGAALWDQLGYRFPFLFGTIFVVLSLYFTQKIDVEKQRVGTWGVKPVTAD